MNADKKMEGWWAVPRVSFHQRLHRFFSFICVNLRPSAVQFFIIPEVISGCRCLGLIPLGARQDARNCPHFPPAVQILIRNIDRSLSQEQITELFRKHGKVTSCTLVMDPKTGQSKGFGFAEMPNMDEASKAISQLNGQKVGSSALRVKRAANSTISKHRGKP
jgi:hypothetical protein